MSILHRLLGESGPAVRVHEGCEPHLSPIGVGLCGPQTWHVFYACPSAPNPSVARAAARARNASNVPPIELHPEPAGNLHVMAAAMPWRPWSRQRFATWGVLHAC